LLRLLACCAFERLTKPGAGEIVLVISAGCLPFKCLLSHTDADHPKRSAPLRSNSDDINLSFPSSIDSREALL
jgi:hypothetical protein